MKVDVSTKRVAAFAKRLLQVALQSPAPFAAGILFLLSEVLKVCTSAPATVSPVVHTLLPSLSCGRTGTSVCQWPAHSPMSAMSGPFVKFFSARPTGQTGAVDRGPAATDLSRRGGAFPGRSRRHRASNSRRAAGPAAAADSPCPDRQPRQCSSRSLRRWSCGRSAAVTRAAEGSGGGCRWPAAQWRTALAGPRRL
jgi:CBF/Mak21 family